MKTSTKLLLIGAVSGVALSVEEARAQTPAAPTAQKMAAPPSGGQPASPAAPHGAPGPARPGAVPSAPAPLAKCTLQVVHALAGPEGVDERLASLKSLLAAPQFSQWKAFKLLSGAEAQLQPGASTTSQLPWGKAATLTYLASVKTTAGRGGVKVALNVEGPKSASKTSATVNEGKALLVMGEPYHEGMLIYAVSCRTVK